MFATLRQQSRLRWFRSVSIVVLCAQIFAVQAQSQHLLALEPYERLPTALSSNISVDSGDILAVAADGRLFVVQSNPPGLIIFDAHLHSVLSSSRISGLRYSWRKIVRVGWLRDTLWLNDIMLQSMHLMSDDGTVVRDAKFYWPDSTMGPFLRTSASIMLADGTALVSPETAASGDNAIIGEPLLKLAKSSEVVDTLAWVSTNHFTLELRNESAPERGVRFSRQPLGDSPIVTTPPDGSTILIVDRTASRGGRKPQSYFTLTSITPTGRVQFSKRFSYAPIPVTAKEADHIADSIARAVRAESSPLFESEGEGRRVIQRQLYLPENHSPVSDVVVGRDHSIWVRREEVPTVVKWELIDASGRRIGSLQLPQRMRIIDGERDSVVVLTTGDDRSIAVERSKVLRRKSKDTSDLGVRH